MIKTSKKRLLSVVLLAVVCGYFSWIPAYAGMTSGGNDQQKSNPAKTLRVSRFLGAGERETGMYSGIPEDFERTCNNKINQQKSFYKPWAVMGYVGWLTNDTLGQVIVGNYTLADETLYSLEFSHTLNPNNPFRRFLQPLISTLEVTGNFTYRNDPAGPIYEFNPYVTLRWADFPWNHYIATTIGFGEGISYDSNTPQIEASTAANGQTEQLLNYLMLEVTFASPKNPQWEFVVRMHHRSGAYGLYNAENAGSTAVGVGVRYRF